MYISKLQHFIGKTSLVEMQMSSSETVEIGEEALLIMRQLLAVHYVEGGVPLPIIALVAKLSAKCPQFLLLGDKHSALE